MFCPQCGKELPEGSAFCDECGATMNAPASAAPNASYSGNAGNGHGNVPHPGAAKGGNKLPVQALICGLSVAVLIILTETFLIIRHFKSGDEAKTESIQKEDVSEEPSDTVSEDTGSFVQAEAERDKDEGVTDDAVKKAETEEADTEKTDGKSVETDIDRQDAEPAATEEGIQSEENKEIGTTGGGMSEDEQKSLADWLSTDEDAEALDFDWFIEMIPSILHSAEPYKLSPDDATRVVNEPLSLNGGWKCYMRGDDENFSSDGERYLHAEIDTDGNNFKLTLYWWLADWDGETHEESGSSVFKGTWDGESGNMHLESDSGEVDLTGFYISDDNEEQYAFGRFCWPSGEKDHIALMRGKW